MPFDISDRWLFRAITGEAASLLYKDKTEEEVLEFLWQKYIVNTHCENEAVKTGCTNFMHSTRENNIQLRQVFQQ